VTRRLDTNERGQAVLMTILFLTVLLGAAAMTLDIGVWYREQRAAQAAADAAALAGAQALPFSTVQAAGLAKSYADSNGGGVSAADITFRSDFALNDTVVVKDKRNVPAFFSKIFDIANVDVHATAAARAAVPEQVFGAAPIVVNKLHPLLSGPGCPCFNVPTTLPLSKTGAPGAFGLVNLDPNENNGVPPLAAWIDTGFDGYLDLGPYFSDTGAKFSGNGINQALTDRLNTELMFPVFDTLTGTGSNAQYNIIGWVAFHLTGYTKDSGNQYQLQGYFTKVIWDGLQSQSNQNFPNFGVYSVALVN